MFTSIKNYGRNRAFLSYISQLGPALVKRYGMADQYTASQIYKTLLDLKLNARYYPYALALYRHEYPECGHGPQVCVETFEAVRQQIAASLFDGNRNYRARHVLAIAGSRRWRGGASPDWRANRFGQTSL